MFNMGILIDLACITLVIISATQLLGGIVVIVAAVKTWKDV